MSVADQTYPALQVINEDTALEAFCADISGCEWIALDTEFIREKTYYPQLCLIQVGTPDRAACIDPLELDSLEPLYRLLFNPAITKVLHACSQDLEIFVHQTGRVPEPIFDTQLAAPLLGLAEQIGYGNFVKELLGVHLDKTQARTDWSQRPLSSKQLEYAADDVRYLSALYPTIRAKLSDQGRLAWLDAEFAPYQTAERYCTRPEDAWQRIRGLDKLRTQAQCAGQQIAAWREAQAQKKNLPRNWVLKDEHLIDIARMAPEDTAALSRIRGLQARTIERYGAKLLELVAAAKSMQPQALPVHRRKSKPSVQAEALADLLHAQLRLLAERENINAASIASRKQLLALIADEPTPLLNGWRRELAGDELLAMRNGKRIVCVENGRLKITQTDD